MVTILLVRWGRKPVMLASGPIVLTSWIIAITTRSISALYIVRIIQGIALAIPYTVTPMYLAEIAEPKLRGQLGSYFQVFFYLGSLFSYSIGPYFSYDLYLYLACIPAVLFIVLFSFVPESPYYLLMIGNDNDARKSLCWLRANQDINDEFNEIKEGVIEDLKLKSNWKDLIATRKDRFALFIVELVCFIRYTNGITCISVYITQTFNEGNVSNETSDLLTIILAIVLIITTICASFVADSFGRRPLMIISTIGATIFNIISAIYFYIDKYSLIDCKPYQWISYCSIIGVCIISNIGLGPLMMTIQAEYFPSHTRAKGGAITCLFTAIACFISLKQYQFIDDNFGMYMNYVIFAIISLIGSIVLWLYLHETAGKTLGQIQKSLAVENKMSGN
ncbi:hypothetical protein O3M35_001862 [Rhynocoris fuscipes]|uniref:Major facilitator superfamily (MFS) profile domain-containing protein n=1 Tax=Rhynocoris fuscipes TaxID=488301 RepID=A0AAW1CPW8_9HEMI